MKRHAYVLFLLAALLVVAACNPATPTPAPTVTIRTDLKMALVTNAQGTIRDGTFNELAYNGALRASRDFGIDLTYRETIEEKDYGPAIDAMVADGRNIIITVGFQMIPVTLEAAKKYPEVRFIGVDFALDEALPNFAGLQFREDQGGFLAGAIAGMMTKSNVVGVVGGIDLPPVVRFVNGFVNGAKYVNPNVTALSVYTGTFADPQIGRSEADKMMGEKADVIFGAGGLTGSSAIAHAASKGMFVIGVDQDEFRTTFVTGQNAEKILTSAVKAVDNGVYATVEAIAGNRFESGARTLSAANCGILYASFNKADAAIPAEVKTRLEAIWSALAGETLLTGADTTDGTPPAPLAAGALPVLKDGAPKIADCRK